VFNPPAVKTVYIDIPGANGKIDMTEALAGYPLYDNREGSFEFIVANGYRASWIGGYQKFANWLHGKDLRCVLDDDPSFYYEGRFSIDNWTSNNDGTWSNVTFNYNVKPFKYSINSSMDDWLWDPFNFETDIIYKLNEISITRQTNFKILNYPMPVIPVLYFKNTNAKQKYKVELNGTAITNIGVGEFRDPRIQLLDGYNDIVVTPIPFTENNRQIISPGTVSISFRGGSL
jgi:hypothetical protein